MGKIIKIVLLIVIVAAAALWITPYLALKNLTIAMENEDAATVDQYVDFHRVSTSFQNDFATSMGADPKADSLSNILATRIAGAFINNIVSPESMVTVLKDHSRRERLGLSPDLMTLIGRGQWINADQFVLHDDYDKPTMLLNRTGTTWEVTAISLK